MFFKLGTIQIKLRWAQGLVKDSRPDFRGRCREARTSPGGCTLRTVSQIRIEYRFYDLHRKAMNRNGFFFYQFKCILDNHICDYLSNGLRCINNLYELCYRCIKNLYKLCHKDNFNEAKVSTENYSCVGPYKKLIKNPDM